MVLSFLSRLELSYNKNRFRGRYPSKNGEVVKTLNSIVLFDGECNFCSASVQFIIKRDFNKRFYFASLQSDIGRKLLKEHNAPEHLDSFVLIDSGGIFLQSTAALRVCKHLKGVYKLLYSFIIIPKPIRNLVYQLIAKNRYKWFGKVDSCMIPTPEVKERFLS